MARTDQEAWLDGFDIQFGRSTRVWNNNLLFSWDFGKWREVDAAASLFRRPRKPDTVRLRRPAGSDRATPGTGVQPQLDRDARPADLHRAVEDTKKVNSLYRSADRLTLYDPWATTGFPRRRRFGSSTRPHAKSLFNPCAGLFFAQELADGPCGLPDAMLVFDQSEADVSFAHGAESDPGRNRYESFLHQQF